MRKSTVAGLVALSLACALTGYGPGTPAQILPLAPKPLPTLQQKTLPPKLINPCASTVCTQMASQAEPAYVAAKTYTGNADIIVPTNVPAGAVWVIETGATVTVKDAGSITNAGTLIIKAGAKLTAAGHLVKNAAGGVIRDHGTLTVNDAGSLDNGGTITVKTGGAVTLAGASMTNQTGTTLNIEAGAQLLVTDYSQARGVLTNLAGGTINNCGRLLFATVYSLAFNSGTITNCSTGYLEMGSTAENKTGGVINNVCGATLMVVPGTLTVTGGTVRNSATMRVGGGLALKAGTLQNDAGGVITDVGTAKVDIAAGASVSNAGTIDNTQNQYATPAINNAGDLLNQCGGVVKGPVSGRAPVNACSQAQ